MDGTNGSRRKRRKHVHHVRAHVGPMIPMPWWEDAVGRLVGRLLVWLSIRAAKRGDWHEFNHIQAQMIGGNSHHTDETPCGLPPHADQEPIRFARQFVSNKMEDD